jgi:hypothetical protein
MATLSELMGNDPAAAPQDSDRESYLMYAENCMMSGRQPLPFPEWVKAGKPSK